MILRKSISFIAPILFFTIPLAAQEAGNIVNNEGDLAKAAVVTEDSLGLVEM
jgi:hypothetical protein